MITAFIQQMHRLILQHAMIEKGEIVLVAVSGGADSLALLYGLHALRSQLDCRLHVAHLNHRLRSDADIDADFVLHHASLLDLPCTVRCSEVPCLVKEWKLSTEAAGRRARYQFYEAVCREVGATKIALGHHRDDIAETVLMNLIRGSGATGLKGIAPIRDFKIIRPLVGFTREHIETFLTAISVKPLCDSTNTDKRYLRNRIRHELIPLLETAYNPNIKAGLRRTAEVLSAESEYLKIVTQTAFETCRISDTAKTGMPGSIILDRAKFRGYHMALQRRMLRQSIFEMLGDLSDLYFVHAEAMLNLIESDTPHAVLALPNGLEFRRVYQQLIFEIRATSGSKQAIGAESFSYPICVPGKTFVPVLKAELAAEVGEVSSYETLVIPNGKFEAIFDYEKLRSVFADTCSFTLRNRRQGDRFQPYGMRGTKKIKDFLIDVKVPRHERDRIPLLVCGDTILWLIGYMSSELFKLKPSTRQYLYLRYVSVHPLS